MQTVKRIKQIPENSVILKDHLKIDYWDSYQIEKQTNDSVDKIIADLFYSPKWVIFLTKIRNSVVGIFGLKTDYNKDVNALDYYPVGSKALYFPVIMRNDHEIVMAENDKHLYFRTSVLVEKRGTLSTVYLTTVVKYNNIWGWLYFLPVKPFHQIIIKTSLKKFLKPVSHE
jgi:hypothetical protein